jgi:phage tail-like protein
MKRSEIEKLLPTVIRRTIRRDNPSVAILEVMSALHEPSEAMIARLDSIFNPFRTPDLFVPFLARWLDLERIFDGAGAPASNRRSTISTGLGCLRALTASASYLSQWRGTKKGLDHFLEIAIGTQGVVIEEQVTGEDGAPIPFHLRVVAPDSTKPHRSLIERIIESEKPAYVTYELVFASSKEINHE